MDAGLRNILWDDASKKWYAYFLYHLGPNHSIFEFKVADMQMLGCSTSYIIDYEAWMHSQDTALGPDGRVAHPIRTLVYWQLIYGTGPDYEW